MPTLHTDSAIILYTTGWMIECLLYLCGYKLQILILDKTITPLSAGTNRETPSGSQPTTTDPHQLTDLLKSDRVSPLTLNRYAHSVERSISTSPPAAWTKLTMTPLT